MKALAPEAVGGSTGHAVGFEHHHLQPVTGGQGSGTKATQATAHHDQVDILGHQRGPLPISVLQPLRLRHRVSRSGRPVIFNLP